MSGKNYGCDGFWPKGVRKGQWQDWLATTGRERAMGNTFNAQTNVDVRALATLDMFLRSNGIEVRGTSELLRECLRLVFQTAVAQGVPTIDDIEEAIDYLVMNNYSVRQFASYRRDRLATALRAEHLGKERGVQESAILGTLTINKSQAENESCDYALPAKDKYDIWIDQRAIEIQKEKNIKIGYAKYEANEEAIAMREAGVEPEEYKEFLAKHKAREEEFAAQKKAQEEFLASLRAQQEE